MRNAQTILTVLCLVLLGTQAHSRNEQTLTEAAASVNLAACSQRMDEITDTIKRRVYTEHPEFTRHLVGVEHRGISFANGAALTEEAGQRLVSEANHISFAVLHSNDFQRPKTWWERWSTKYMDRHLSIDVWVDPITGEITYLEHYPPRDPHDIN